MAPPKSGTGAPLLTEKEQRLAAIMLMCQEGDPKYDYKKVAELGGYTEGSARQLVCALKRKLKAPAAVGGTKRKTKATAGGMPEDDDDDEDLKSPKKKASKPEASPAVDIKGELEEWLA